MTLFPFAQYWWLYAAFLLIVFVILLLDLGVFNKTPHEPSFKEASLWTVAWVTLAGVINIGLYQYVLYKFTNNPHLLPEGFTAPELASKLGLEFTAGYVVEKTLAIDNIFVFALVFSFFKVPVKFQHRVLFWGIIGALIFRGIFIALGSVLMQYHLVVVAFGILLMVTAIKIPFQKDEGDIGDKWVIQMIKKLVPVYPDTANGSFVRVMDNRKGVTTLFLALMVIEVSDIIFAIDSVPAIFALTNEPLIVFTSNIMAILGLRSMYFMLSGFMDKFEYIKYGLASVLLFVGLKMSWFNGFYGPKIPITWSLLVIFTLISSSMLISLNSARKKKAIQ